MGALRAGLSIQVRTAPDRFCSIIQKSPMNMIITLLPPGFSPTGKGTESNSSPQEIPKV